MQQYKRRLTFLCTYLKYATKANEEGRRLYDHLEGRFWFRFWLLGCFPPPPPAPLPVFPAWGPCTKEATPTDLRPHSLTRRLRGCSGRHKQENVSSHEPEFRDHHSPNSPPPGDDTAVDGILCSSSKEIIRYSIASRASAIKTLASLESSHPSVHGSCRAGETAAPSSGEK